jgi:hypothetical protein
MPRLPKNYSKNVIYKLVCNDLNILGCYVGHTTDFTRRKACHKSDCDNENGSKYNYKVYKTIRENGGFNNYSMIEVEKHPCRDENEATARERHWFEILNSGLNTIYPQRSPEEYYADNRNNILIQQRQYYADNRDNILIQQRQYYTDNRDNILIQQRQYHTDNREEILIRKGQYDATHKEEIATRQKQTFSCECGKVITWGMKSRHFKTKFHLQYVESIPVVPVVQSQAVPPITAEQLVRGICYIPLAQFENTKQHKEINDDHFYFSNHYDYMCQH